MVRCDGNQVRLERHLQRALRHGRIDGLLVLRFDARELIAPIGQEHRIRIHEQHGGFHSGIAATYDHDAFAGDILGLQKPVCHVRHDSFLLDAPEMNRIVDGFLRAGESL